MCRPLGKRESMALHLSNLLLLFWSVRSCLLFILYAFMPKSLQTSLRIDSLFVFVSMAIFRLLGAGFRLIRCSTLLVKEIVRAVRGRPGRGRSNTSPVSENRDEVREINILL